MPFVEDKGNFQKIMYILENASERETLFVTTEILVKCYAVDQKIGVSEISKA